MKQISFDLLDRTQGFMNNFLPTMSSRNRSFSRDCPLTCVFNDSLQFNHLCTVLSRSIRNSSFLPLILKLISVSTLGALLVSACPLISVSPTVSWTVLGPGSCCSYEVAFVLRAKPSLSLYPLTYTVSHGVHTLCKDNYDQAAFLFPNKPDVMVLMI